MRKFLMIIVACLAVTSCELDFSGNGDLDGFWQMTAADTVATGGTRDMGDRRIYWSVQKKLLEVRQIPENYYGIIFHFDHSGGRLVLREPYRNLRDSGDVKISDPAVLAPYGIHAIQDTFSVLELNSEKMILESKVLRLHFRRY